MNLSFFQPERFLPHFSWRHFLTWPKPRCSFIGQNEFHFSPCWMIFNPAFCHPIRIWNGKNSSVEQNEKRRLDCLAFLRLSETGQTKRRDMHLDGDALNVRF
jgi:hypothetical protein